MKHVEYDDTKHKQVFFHRRPEINKAIEEVSSHKKARKSQRKIPFMTFGAFLRVINLRSDSFDYAVWRLGGNDTRQAQTRATEQLFVLSRGSFFATGRDQHLEVE